MGKIMEYSTKLDSISKNLEEEEFENLTMDNLNCKLQNFGYDYACSDNNGKFFNNNGEKIDYESLKDSTGLYVFQEISEGYITEEKWKAFKKDEKMENDKVPAWNNKYEETGDVFYVGKSNKIGQRIKEHTCKSSNSTYALKLNKFNEINNETSTPPKYKLHVFYLTPPDNENKIKAINELVEAILHKKLMPCIGTSR